MHAVFGVLFIMYSSQPRYDYLDEASDSSGCVDTPELLKSDTVGGHIFGDKEFADSVIADSHLSSYMESFESGLKSVADWDCGITNSQFI